MKVWIAWLLQLTVISQPTLSQWDLLPSANKEPARGTFVIATGKMNITVNRSPLEERRVSPARGPNDTIDSLFNKSAGRHRETFIYDAPD